MSDMLMSDGKGSLGEAHRIRDDLSDDSDDERDTKYNILDVEDGAIQEEDEFNECDECCGGGHNDDSGDELPLIKDVHKA